MRSLIFVASLLGAGAALAERPVDLNDESFNASAGEHGVIVFEVNWGRQWGCAGLDNAQLQALTFSQAPDGTTLELKTPSRLFVDSKFKPYALLVDPGKYFLTNFDVKVAKSVSDVGHLIGDGEIGGSFDVVAGEFVYIGHFGLDCSAEPIPWRYYIEGVDDFDRYVEGFREQFPFVGEVTVEFRLFQSTLFGTDYLLGDGT